MEAGIAARPSGASSADRMPADPPSRRPPTSQMDDTGAGEWPSGTPDGWGSLVDLHLDASGVLSSAPAAVRQKPNATILINPIIRRIARSPFPSKFERSRPEAEPVIDVSRLPLPGRSHRVAPPIVDIVVPCLAISRLGSGTILGSPCRGSPERSRRPPGQAREGGARG